MALKTWFARQPGGGAARRLYDAIVTQARQPAFYEDLGVPDTLDGRFEMITLHAFLLLHRLKREPERTAALAQAVFDTMFLDMDASLREMGAGDLGVGRRVKQMATGFYGRVAAYEAGLADDAGPGLSKALRRNLYGTVEVAPRLPDAMAAYARAAAAALAAQPLEMLLAGHVEFPAPETISGDLG